MQIKSIMINGIEQVGVINEVIDETKLNPTEAFIETYYTHISPGTELSRVYGIKKGAAYPFRPGYCAVGKVLAKGDNLPQVEVGDIVLYSGTHSNYHVYNYLTSDGGILYKLDPKLSHDQAVCLIMCWIAMNGILIADVKITDTVAIFGLGVLGSILTTLYKEAGVKVIGVDPIKNRGRSVDADHIIQSSDPIPDIMKLTNNKGVDIAVDCSGNSQAICTAILATRKNGQVILLGSPRSDYETNITPILNAINMKMLTIKGAFNRLFPYEEKEGSRLSIKQSLDYLSTLMIKNTIDYKTIVSHIITPEQAFSAYQGLMNDKENYIGVIIDWKK